MSRKFKLRYNLTRITSTLHEDECTFFYRISLNSEPERKSPLGRPRRRWEDNIKMDLQEVGGGRGNWMELAQDRDRLRALVGTVRDFRVP
jgi:hypothetical protein